MSQVKALTNIRDNVTGVLHMAGDVFELDRPPEELQRLMKECFIEIMDPAIRPAILIKADDTKPSADMEKD